MIFVRFELNTGDEIQNYLVVLYVLVCTIKPKYPKIALGSVLQTCGFGLYYQQLEYSNSNIKMGCLISENKAEERLSPLDSKIIWRKCLKVDSITLSQHKRKQHPVFLQIAKDIDRTFPNHSFFNDTNNKKQFQKVLQEFALKFPKVGYTQGLNFIAGFLLISGLNQQQATKTLIALLTHPELMLIGLYQDEFPLCRLYCQLFWSITQKVCPQAFKHLQSIGLPDEVWIFQWFITLFIYSFPVSYIKDLLNFIVVKRYFAAVRLAVAILYYLQKYITSTSTKSDGFLDCLQLIKTEQFCAKYLPVQNVIKKAEKINKQLILQCLRNSKQTSWYRHYFALGAPEWQKKYAKLMEDFKLEREKFMAEEYSSISSNRVSCYAKLPESMTIIDNIEQSVSKKFEKALSRSSLDKNVPFFSRLSSKNYNSVGTIEMQRINSLK